jgi:hypothetical protein
MHIGALFCLTIRIKFHSNRFACWYGAKSSLLFHSDAIRSRCVLVPYIAVNMNEWMDGGRTRNNTR